MRKVRKPYIQLFAITMSLLLLAACSGKAEEAGDAADANKPAGKESTKMITMPWSKDIGPLNPHLYEPNQMFAQGMVYESLVEYSKGGQIIPQLAERWTISDDGKSYTFFLRKNVKYSDGSVFNADNVKRNFDAVMANKERHSWMGIVNVIDSVDKVDDFTVKLQLKSFYYPVLQELSFVRPFRFLGDAGFPEGGKTSQTIQQAVGTGPWVLTEYKKDEYAVFSKNEHYWGEKPKVDKIKVKIMPDSESIAVAFEKKELDLIYGKGVISLDSYKYLKESGKYGIGSSDPLTTRTVLLNSQKGPTSELAVRQAIQYGIDKETMVKSVTHGTEIIADTVLSKDIPYAGLDLQPIRYNPEKAKQLLEEAGWKTVPGKQVREKDGKPLVLDFVYISTDAVQKPLAEIIQGELAKIGVQVNLQGADVMVGLQKLKSGECHLNFWSTYGPPNDPHNLATVSAQPSASGIYEAQLGLPNKKEIDGLIKQALVSHNETERKMLYKSILTNIHEQAVFYPISYESNIAVYQKNVTGLTPTASKYMFPLTGLDLKP
ncbi:MAG: sodium:proton antiporter [Paenibacillus sp.]|nr:sodium:proton antiporter [Paenibacillus sp.]